MSQSGSGYHSIPLSFNRKAVRASAAVSARKSVIHNMTEVDVSLPRGFIQSHREKTGEKLSLIGQFIDEVRSGRLLTGI